MGGGASKPLFFPFLDEEFGLLFDSLVAHFEFEVLGPNTFIEGECCTATIVAYVRALTRKEGHEFVVARFQVTYI